MLSFGDSPGLIFPELLHRQPVPGPISNGQKICLILVKRSRCSSTAPTSTRLQRLLGFDIDYKRLLQEFQTKGYLLRAYYYTALAEDQEYSSIRPLIDWLDYNGYTVVTKPTKEFVDASGRRKIKGNMDIELAVDAMEMAESIDHLVLFSGDGDFRSLVEALQRRGRKVSVISTLSTQPPMIADDLRRQADHFVDLLTLQPKIGRDPSERAQRQHDRGAGVDLRGRVRGRRRGLSASLRFTP